MQKQMKWRRIGISVVIGLAFGGMASPAVASVSSLSVLSASVSTSATGAVSPGAFCSSEGAIGKTKAGTKMKCKSTAKDRRLRWRRA